MHRSLFLKEEFYHDLKMIKNLVKESKAHISGNSYDMLDEKKEVALKNASEINENQSTKMEVSHANLNEHNLTEQDDNNSDESKVKKDIFGDVDQNSIF
ncbi:hypothetical protein ACT7DC_02960 [Bacillus cereus]